MYIIIPVMAIVLVSAFVIAFVFGRKRQYRIASGSSPFSFAEDMLIVNTETIFSVQSSSIESIELQYNPKAIKNKFYEIKIQIVKTDGSVKIIHYRGSGSGVQPQDMAATLTARHIKCVVKN